MASCGDEDQRQETYPKDKKVTGVISGSVKPNGVAIILHQPRSKRSQLKGESETKNTEATSETCTDTTARAEKSAN